jgi:site-specific DNA-methyltransferase (adenine-specific)
MAPLQNRSLFFGDNLEILREKFPGNEGYFDLIYLDPPFNSNRNYNVLFKEGLVDSEAQAHAFEDSWHWTNEAQHEFEELVKNAPEEITNLIISLEKAVGHNDVLAYLVMMTTRLLELYRVLKTTGSLYLHCDPTASHYLKIVLDAIFGKDNFRNEIIWHYRTGGVSKRWFGKKHDVIFFYTKSDKYFFNPLEVKEYYDSKPGFLDRNSGQDKGGYYHYVYEDDVFDIKAVFNMSKERLGYPTQKPEALLEKILMASSKEGDWILDPFCGCGTTVAEAEKLNRNWNGIDISMLAVKLIERRSIHQKPSLRNQIYINGLPRDMAGAHQLADQNPFDFEYWVAVHLLDAKPPAGKSQDNMKGADKGVDGVITLVTNVNNGDSEYGKVIVQVKGGHVQRNQVATLRSDIQSQHAIAGVFVCIEKPTPPMRIEAAQAGTVRTQLGEFPIIQIMTVEELLLGRHPKLPGMISPYKQALAFQPTIPQASLDI